MNPTPSDPQPDPSERIARHLRQCRRMGEIGLALYEATAERAMNALIDAESSQTADPAVPPPKPHDESLALARYSRIVYQAMAAETRLAAGPARTASVPSPAMSDPRRAPLRRGLHITTEFRPDRKALRRQIDSLLDQKLTADPGHKIEIATLFMAICDDIGIKPDLGKIPDECLGFNIPGPPDDDEPDDVATSVLSDEFYSYLKTGYPIPKFGKAGGLAPSTPTRATGPGPLSDGS